MRSKRKPKPYAWTTHAEKHLEAVPAEHREAARAAYQAFRDARPEIEGLEGLWSAEPFFAGFNEGRKP